METHVEWNETLFECDVCWIDAENIHLQAFHNILNSIQNTFGEVIFGQNHSLYVKSGFLFIKSHIKCWFLDGKKLSDLPVDHLARNKWSTTFKKNRWNVVFCKVYYRTLRGLYPTPHWATDFNGFFCPYNIYFEDVQYCVCDVCIYDIVCHAEKKEKSVNKYVHTWTASFIKLVFSP